MLAIRIPKEIEERLEQLAQKTGRTKTFYAREAIMEHIEDLEDYYLAAEILARVRKGKEKTVPIETLIKRYGLED
jgi:RHH-type rel operon transcriptional repressor/antitoxin RelB